MSNHITPKLKTRSETLEFVIIIIINQITEIRGKGRNTTILVNRFYLNSGSPSGSDVSESSVPATSSSHVYLPASSTATTTTAADEPSTLLSLSLPGVESSEGSSVGHSPSPAITPLENLFPSAEFLSVVQEMIRMEVRNYVTGGNDGVRAAAEAAVASRFGINRIH